MLVSLYCFMAISSCSIPHLSAAGIEVPPLVLLSVIDFTNDDGCMLCLLFKTFPKIEAAILFEHSKYQLGSVLWFIVWRQTSIDLSMDTPTLSLIFCAVTLSTNHHACKWAHVHRVHEYTNIVLLLSAAPHCLLQFCQ